MLSGFQQRINVAEVFFQFIHVQTIKERLLVGQSEKHLSEHGRRFLHVGVALDFTAFFCFPYDFLPQFMVLAENPLDFLSDARIIHTHL